MATAVTATAVTRCQLAVLVFALATAMDLVVVIRTARANLIDGASVIATPTIIVVMATAAKLKARVLNANQSRFVVVIRCVAVIGFN